MHRLRRGILLQGLIALDMTILAAALALGLFLTAIKARPTASVEFLSARVRVGEVLAILAFLAACRGLFARCGLYQSRRLGPRSCLYRQIAVAVSIATLLLAGIGALVPIRTFAGTFLLWFWGAALATLAGSRALFYRFLEACRNRGRNLRYILIAGAGPRGRRFAADLESRPELGYVVLGFLDDAELPSGCKARLMGRLGDLGRILRTQEVDEVAVALPIKSFYAEASRIISVCEQHGVIVRLPGDVFEARLARVESEQFEGLSIVTLFTGRGSAFSFWLKRVLDLTLAGTALLLLLPFLGLIALAIKLDSPGSVLFRQVRLGYHGRRFRVLKFRTMVADAEERQGEVEHLNEVDGAAFKMRNDPRVTRIGRWLRRASLDELPQLINVLRGEMSLVGPRPLPLRDVEQLQADWPRRRFSVPPGLTGPWQAAGRHRIRFDDWMRMDLDYIDNWSLFLDFKILLRTVPAVWTGAGAS